MRGCWLGKNYGGAVGIPFEGCPGPRLDAAFPVLPKLVPNDDLEMQFLAIAAMEATGRWPEAAQMGTLWRQVMDFAPDEYGIALRNLEAGLLPPASGRVDNWFSNGMGAVIRSEIWACLRPGDPHGAAVLARNDASIDHAGDGLHASAFLAALQSVAFTGEPLETCIALAEECLPEDSTIRGLIHESLRLADSALDEDAAIRQLHSQFAHANFTDFRMNLAFILFALIRGKGDLDHSLHLALRCGEDADCTGASVGATLGILRGEELAGTWETLPEKIEISPNFTILNPPSTIQDLTSRITVLKDQLRDQDPVPWVDQGEPSPFRHEWLLVAAEDASDLPKNLAVHLHDPQGQNPPVIEFEGVWGALASAGSLRPTALHLVSWFSVPTDTEAWLLVTADAGLTVWLDGKMVGNYHGRRPMLPTFHRTEGGCCVPVQLLANVSHQIHLRLLYPHAPWEFCATLGDGRGHHLPGLRFRAAP